MNWTRGPVVLPDVGLETDDDDATSTRCLAGKDLLAVRAENGRCYRLPIVRGTHHGDRRRIAIVTTHPPEPVRRHEFARPHDGHDCRTLRANQRGPVTSGGTGPRRSQPTHLKHKSGRRHPA
ncbi:hypothetical protein [Cellulosimicrobium funkei]|uniref:Uncharacterized protein n=1 Tax=Cellulosimicrobium funkei TaxID=264251 RepID=A0A4Y8R7X0_9MICO|nr:hypothetical protein [Cellulosimicrobium funkei]TFF17325.1 hypothetical protein E1O70_00570 [Cellulosimicrobium funkei]TGA74147.1 hypothetical protein EQW79_008955 [Cellulosimicrobium terreum]